MRWARSASIAAFSVGVGRICFAQESPFEKRFGKPKNEVLTMEEFFIRCAKKKKPLDFSLGFCDFFFFFFFFFFLLSGFLLLSLLLIPRLRSA